MRMKPPVSRLVVYGSNGMGRSSSRFPTPISFSSSVVVAMRAKVLTLILYFSGLTVAVTVRAPIFSSYPRPGKSGASLIHPMVASN